MKFVKGEYEGVYRGIVENNNDPMELGRVQVRIPALHGNPDTGVFTQHLPWALPCVPYASFDAGMLLVPEVQSVVFVMFENGEESSPIYIGQMYSKGSDELKEFKSNNYGDTENTRYRKKFEDDTIKGTYRKGKFSLYTLFKSPKGATIEIDDTDKEERISLFDKLGQTLTFYSPEEESYGGVYDRGLFNVLKNKFSRTIYKTSIVIMKTISKSKLRFMSNKSNSQVDLKCVYKDRDSGIQVNIGKDNRLVVYYGDSVLELSDEKTQIQSKKLVLKADEMEINSPSIRSSVNIRIGDFDVDNVNPITDSNEEQGIIK